MENTKMTHLTLKLETGTVKVTREQVLEAIKYGFEADNVLKWVFCAVVGKRRTQGLATGRRSEPKMEAEALRLCREGSSEVLDCRVSAWVGR